MSLNALAQTSSVWQDFPTQKSSAQQNTLVQRSLLLDEPALRQQLNGINQGAANQREQNNTARFIQLPLPQGGFIKVRASASQVMSPAMAEAYPALKTWDIVGAESPAITGTIDFTSNGFHAMLLMPDGDTVFIDPNKEQGGDVYQSISKKQNIVSFSKPFNCKLAHDHSVHSPFGFAKRALPKPNLAKTALSTASFPDLALANTKTYRIALSTTAEYTASLGGVAGARSAMLTLINRINPMFKRDLGINLQLQDLPQLIFSDPNNDPFSNPSTPNSLMLENASTVSTLGLLGRFDIGHVLSSRTLGGSAGVAFVGVACLDSANTQDGIVNGIKAAGASTSSSPSSEAFNVRVVAHELAHQLGAFHTFNSTQGQICTTGREGRTAVEPGSGSTIMSYAGICGADNLPNSPRDDYFHFASISQVTRYTRAEFGRSCGTVASGSAATADAGANARIPARTPFMLRGSTSGGTSSWDQIDIGPASSVSTDNGQNAIIRHIIPTNQRDRYIPNLSDLFSNRSSKGELLPTSSRELNFAYVVRNGGVASSRKKLAVTDTRSAFSVVSQRSGTTITTNRPLDVVWNVADTNVPPISCSKVDIQLIRQDGSKNMLLAGTTNDGAEQFIVPASTPSVSGARIYVGCSDQPFFNISSGNIIVQTGGANPGTPNPNPARDTTPPVITLQGAKKVTLIQGATYIEPGATAMDDRDGKVQVTISTNLNNTRLGTYTITYTATDAAGNVGKETRTVEVVAQNTPQPDPGTPAPDPTPNPDPTPDPEPDPTPPSKPASGGGGAIDDGLLALLLLLGFYKTRRAHCRIHVEYK